MELRKRGAPRLPRHLKKRKRAVAMVTEAEFIMIRRRSRQLGFMSIGAYLRSLIDDDLSNR